MPDQTSDTTASAARMEQDVVYQWLEAHAKQMRLKAKFYRNLARQDHNWIYLPVFVEGADVVEKAAKLQRLEDAWRNQEPEPYWQLLLIPAAN